MAYVAFTPQLGEVNLTDVDIGGPGPYALVGANAGKYGRNSFYGEILEGYDPFLGAGEFVYAQCALAVVPGQVVQFSLTQDSNLNMVLQATPWTGTTYAGQELGIAIVSLGTNQYGWFQVGGNAIVYYGGTTAGQTISSISITNQTATVTTSGAHGLAVGTAVTLSGVTPSTYNGSYVIATVPSTTTFTLAYPASNTPASNATVVGSYTYYSGSVTGQTVSSGSASGAVATLITSAAHNLQVGNTVVVAGATPTAYNGTYAVSAVANATSFTYTASTAPGGTTSAQPTYTITSPALNGQAYYSANGSLQANLVAGKHLVGGQWSLGTSGIYGQAGTGRVTLPSNQALLWVGRPNSQGSNT